MKLTNEHGISLPLAVWLLHDDYDYNPDPYYISATSLLKSVRQIILSKRVQSSDLEIDISVFLASRFGNAIHDSIQKAWEKSGRDGMRKLGYPEQMVTKIVVNPDPEWLKLNPGYIAVWIERRTTKQIKIGLVTFTIGGKFDMVMDGRLFDTKTTSVWSYILGNKDEEYGAQGAIYKWLNPDIILEDHIYIQFIFTDWQKMMSKRDPKYPQTKALEYPVKMPSPEEIELFIRLKLSQVEKYKNAPDEDIPYCTDKELWRSEPSYKYYADPQKTMRSTKNFDDLAEANAYMASKGGKGVVLTVPGEVKACDYCPAFSVCKQKDNYYVAP